MLAALFGAGCTAQTKASRAAPANREIAVVVDSGSTNTLGFRVEVERSGAVRYTPQGRAREETGEQPGAQAAPHTVPAALARRLFDDLAKARPLRALPARPCIKSASFGSTLTIEYRGETTPDLSCGGGADPRMQALARDAQEVAAGFRRPRHPL